MIHNVISFSGGKDSTAMLLLALESKVENLSVIFCDTGNEQQTTYDYVNYISKQLDLMQEMTDNKKCSSIYGLCE